MVLVYRQNHGAAILGGGEIRHPVSAGPGRSALVAATHCTRALVPHDPVVRKRDASGASAIDPQPYAQMAFLGPALGGDVAIDQGH